MNDDTGWSFCTEIVHVECTHTHVHEQVVKLLLVEGADVHAVHAFHTGGDKSGHMADDNRTDHEFQQLKRTALHDAAAHCDYLWYLAQRFQLLKLMERRFSFGL